MKKILNLVIILGATTVLGLTSCERTHCYECTTERYYLTLPENTIEHIDRASKVHCDETTSSIRDIEINGTHYTTYNRDGKIIQEHTVTTCK